MKKNYFKSLMFAAVCFVNCHCFCSETSAMSNPWIECGDDIGYASAIAGFNFPLNVDANDVRVMNDMLEINFYLNDEKYVSARKSKYPNDEPDENGLVDISGDYTAYSVDKVIKLPDGSVLNVRGEEQNYHVLNFAAFDAYYSFTSRDGLNFDDVSYLYDLLREAERQRTSDKELDSFRQDIEENDNIDIRPSFTEECFPRTLQKKGVTEECFEKANMGYDIFCSNSEIKMIREYYQKGVEEDPLYGSYSQYCAQ